MTPGDLPDLAATEIHRWCGWAARPCATSSSAKAQLRADCRCGAGFLSRSFGSMNGALTYAVVAVHETELRAAAERSRRVPRAKRRERRLPALPWRRRPRRAYA